MTILKDYYSENVNEAKEKLAATNKRLTSIIIARILSFIGLIVSVYFLFGIPYLSLLVPLLIVVLFMFLLKKHGRLLNKKEYFSALLRINTNELSSLSGNFDFAESGIEFIDSDHSYSHDMDLFGEGSFFQKINRTVTANGKNSLAKELTSNNIKNIAARQDGLKELAVLSDWRQDFLAQAAIRKKQLPADSVQNWLVQYRSSLPKSLKWITYIFSFISILMLIGLSIGVVSGIVFAGWFTLGIIVTGVFLKNTAKFANSINGIGEEIKVNAKLIALIENHQFSSAYLQELQSLILRKEEKASLLLKQLSRQIDLFNNRNNLIVGVFGNALFLWDAQAILRLESWFNKYKDNVNDWFETIYAFDAQISLGNFIYNHPSYTFPHLSTSKDTFVVAEQLGHPLINSTTRIDNDIHLNDAYFFIITGANMAGKSTFLRTIGLSVIMANCGLPVCATSFIYVPKKLITSMRSTDSLKDNESYFFSELKRLKRITEEIQSDDYFIILDEILKGTNSKDKEEGSKKFVQRLTQSHSTGIIATHDLGLCEIEKEYQQIENYYFDAEIVNDELFFDYKMKKGICKNMNASFLLRKMEIVNN